MIGVIASENETKIVAEFFQLFKTPWEFFKAGKSYPVVITTQPSFADVNATLLLHFSSNFSERDSELDIVSGRRYDSPFLRFNKTKIPVYGQALTFAGSARSICFVDETREAAGIELHFRKTKVLRLGYDLFQEVGHLLSAGQPKTRALFPTLDLHISMLRDLILGAGIPIVEIPPLPAGHDFIACLTHDVDFVRIRDHKFDHTMWGFLYRATIGAMQDFLRKRISAGRLLKNWKSALSLPFVLMGVTRDFWLQFKNYIAIEEKLPSTFFFIPFKNRPGDNLQVQQPKRRATRYDISDVVEWIGLLQNEGKEVAVHGIDAWHNAEKGREEIERISEFYGGTATGIRMHWLCFQNDSFQTLERAGFHYDSTFGYNDAVGFRAGTAQVFRPLDVTVLLELPLIIQDTALFYPREMGLSERRAWKLVNVLLRHCERAGGALTILWHQRSLAPERLWGDFYVRLLKKLKKKEAWFASARDVVSWFQKRRDVEFKAVTFMDHELRLELSCDKPPPVPSLILRVHQPQGCDENRGGKRAGFKDIPWHGQKKLQIPLTTE